MYYIEISDGKISGKGMGPVIGHGQLEVTEELYNELIRLPANFEEDEEGNIVSVVCPPEPAPELQSPSLEERTQALEDVVTALLFGGEPIV